VATDRRRRKRGRGVSPFSFLAFSASTALRLNMVDNASCYSTMDSITCFVSIFRGTENVLRCFLKVGEKKK
jgi:hypothetical protein